MKRVNERRQPHLPQMSSAPHQPRRSDGNETVSVHLLVRFKLSRKKAKGKSKSDTASSPKDLPPDLFPPQKLDSSSKWLLLIALPVALFIAFYSVANKSVALVEEGKIEHLGFAHSVVCTGLDIAIAAGFGFEAHFERANCLTSRDPSRTPDSDNASDPEDYK